MGEVKIKDIYKGEQILAWEDDEYVFLTFFCSGTTLSFPKDAWEQVKKELGEVTQEK